MLLIRKRLGIRLIKWILRYFGFHSKTCILEFIKPSVSWISVDQFRKFKATNQSFPLPKCAGRVLLDALFKVYAVNLAPQLLSFPRC